MVARSGPSMINILGPVAVAAGIAGLAFKHFSDELAEAEARMVAAANRAAMMTSIFGRIKTEKARLALELAVARGEAQVGDLTPSQAKMATELHAGPTAFAGPPPSQQDMVNAAEAVAKGFQTTLDSTVDKLVELTKTQKIHNWATHIHRCSTK